MICIFTNTVTVLPEEREFQEAARIGNEKAVKTFIRNRINVNCMDEV